METGRKKGRLNKVGAWEEIVVTVKLKKKKVSFFFSIFSTMGIPSFQSVNKKNSIKKNNSSTLYIGWF